MVGENPSHHASRTPPQSVRLIAQPLTKGVCAVRVVGFVRVYPTKQPLVFFGLLLAVEVVCILPGSTLLVFGFARLGVVQTPATLQVCESDGLFATTAALTDDFFSCHCFKPRSWCLSFVLLPFVAEAGRRENWETTGRSQPTALATTRTCLPPLWPRRR